MRFNLALGLNEVQMLLEFAVSQYNIPKLSRGVDLWQDSLRKYLGGHATP